ncbi:MAG: TlpA disulfide reductase family protein [Pyrinomonadaceae bacterium]
MGTSVDTVAEKPQGRVAARLARAYELQRSSSSGAERGAAVVEMEAALALARATPYEIEFRTRVELALALAEAYLVAGEMEKARGMIDEEAVFVEKIFQIMQATGTPEQKRAAAGGRIQVRDRARQLTLIGAEAPEIAVREWIEGEPATLADLRGRVVLLEFWATWCKPCQEMFPKLRRLDEEYRGRGLEVVALTRHYLASRDTAQSLDEELELMRNVIGQHDLKFRVGVAEDERTQELYGATGLPTLALVDRAGVVRYAHFGGGEDERFKSILTRCLDERV